MLVVLIVPNLRYTSVAYQVSLVQPWSVFWQHVQGSAKISVVRSNKCDKPLNCAKQVIKMV